MALRVPFLYKTLLVVLICMCALPYTGTAQSSLSNVTYLKNARLNTIPNVRVWMDSVNNSHAKGYAQVLLQFFQLPTEEQKKTLLQNNIRLLDHVPDNAFTAIVQLPFTGNIDGVPLAAIVNIADEWKADKNVWDKVNADTNATVAVMVNFDIKTSEQDIRTVAASAGGTIEKDKLEAYGTYKVIIAANKVKTLAHSYCIKYISPVAKYANADNAAKATSRINIINQPVNRGGYGLLGDSVTVGVGDDVSGVYHIDMLDRVINYNPAAMRHHGVFTNGIVASAGIVDPLAEGVAPHATLVNQLYDNILQFTGLYRQQYNMNVTNNSYVTIEGDCNYSGTYDVYAQFIDELTLQYPSVFHVFAAGNDGLLNCTPYPKGYATVAGGYQASKNALVVTSDDKYYNNAYDASRGPVRDGRLKPELTAVGYYAYSCIDVTNYEFASGTSFASPHAAGAAALLTQRYKALHNMLPNSDLLKALMLAGATDVGATGPDYTFGYGFMNVQHSMQILDGFQYYTNAVNNGVQQTVTINVPANTGKLKVMLYWNDAVGSPLAGKQLVNDLDLLVQSPNGTVHKPLVLDPTPANMNNDAVEGTDHLNNSEEVLINAPVAGQYVVTINGYNVPSAQQSYVMAYDLEPVGVKLTNPLTATKVAAGQPVDIYWDAPDVTNTFTLQYSADSGTTWHPVASNLGAGQRFYGWTPDTTISSGKCLIKLTRDNTADVSVSGTFVISPQPVAAIDAVQCPGYINMHWTPTPNATSYKVLRKVGPYMRVVDSTTVNSYSMQVPAEDSTYYVAVSPVVDGQVGYRSLAVWRRPVDGSCAGFPAGDLAVVSTTLHNERQFTTNQFTNAQSMVVLLRNLYTSPATNYSLAYSVNGGVWSTLFSPPAIPADTAINVTLPGLHLGTPGTYIIKVAVHNIGTADPNHKNDTLITQVTNIANPVLSLTTPFTDGFETMPILTLFHDSVGISPNGHWDYHPTTDTGRLRTFVDDSNTISGARSISLDAALTIPFSNINYLSGTFNLSAYDTSTAEIRMEFDYLMHGTPKTNAGNQVFVRGIDNKPYNNIFFYDIVTYPGTVLHSGSLSLTDVLLHNGQNFSASTQVQFNQNDTSLIAAKNYGNGVTIDNFTLYTVQNDVQLVSIISPQTVNCGLTSGVPLTVLVHNGVKQPQNNVLLHYQLDNGTIYTDTLKTIAGKDSVQFTFKELMNLAAAGQHTLNVYLTNNGDSYTANDSILNYSFYNQPLIATFPYLENFEAGPGNWFTEGLNDSWQYGTPASAKIHKAASGTKAWKTNLAGSYNNLETSYLYSPCFDISKLSSPMLSFSTAMDIENCGTTLCDGAYMEYSYDGAVWTKLGSSGQGTNWYDAAFNIWNTEGNTRWHVASIPLPASTQPVRFRFVLKSDPGATFEGIAVDDIHIFDRVDGIYSGNTPDHISSTPNTNVWLPVVDGGNVIAELNSFGQKYGTSGTLDVGVYNNYNYTNPGRTQYVFPRNFVVKAKQATNDSIGVRFFVLDAEMVDLLNDTGCNSCTRPEDVYAMGVSKYDNADAALENGTLSDNVGGTYTYYPYPTIQWVPYDNGYYAQLTVRSFSEFWFNDGGPNGAFSVGEDYLSFHANKITPKQVQVDWISDIDTLVSNYLLQRSMDGNTFTTINTTPAVHQPAPTYVYVDTPAVNIGSSVYYRLLYYFNTGDSLYSPVRRVDWTDENELINLYPNPTQGQINIQWTATAGTPLQIEMADATGRVVLRKTITSKVWNNLTTLQTMHFASGVYFMKILVGSREYVKKVVYQ